MVSSSTRVLTEVVLVELEANDCDCAGPGWYDASVTLQRACEACRIAIATIDEPDGCQGDPYHVCGPCHQRLTTLALRPVEWYNLASIHGWQRFLLHDDFYDSDGTATQPKASVGAVGALGFPALADRSGSAWELFGYSRTQWSLSGDLVEAWRGLSRTATVPFLEGQLQGQTDPHAVDLVLEICQRVLLDAAADLLRAQWDRLARTNLSGLSLAAPKCLPQDEALPRLFLALSELDSSIRRENAFSLAGFRSEKVLD